MSICASVFTELLFGTTFWDYSDIPFNLGGRINLLYCFFGGSQRSYAEGNLPAVLRLDRKDTKENRSGADVDRSCFDDRKYDDLRLALARYSARQTGAAPTNAIEQQLDEHFPDSRMQRIYPKAKFV